VRRCNVGRTRRSGCPARTLSDLRLSGLFGRALNQAVGMPRHHVESVDRGRAGCPTAETDGAWLPRVTTRWGGWQAGWVAGSGIMGPARDAA